MTDSFAYADNVERAAGPCATFVQSALYAAVQSPYEGVSQLVNHICRHEILPTLHFVDRPAPTVFGSAKWHAEQLGSAAGIVADYLIAARVAGPAFRRLGLMKTIAEESYGLGELYNRCYSPGVSGFVLQGVFQPSLPEEGNFWRARVVHAMAGAYTFSALNAGTSGVGFVSKLAANAGCDFLSAALTNKVVAGATGGALAGVFDAEMNSLLNGRGWASKQQLLSSVYSYSVVGGCLSAARMEGPGVKSIGYGILGLPQQPGLERNKNRHPDESQWQNFPISQRDDIVAGRRKLVQLADRYISNEQEAEEFKSNLLIFERRSAARKLADSEVRDTYDQAAKLMDEKTGTYISQENRIQLAEQMIEQAADPGHIDQGYHNTCAIASIEDRLYTLHPAKVASVIAGVAFTGQFHDSAGNVVKISPMSIMRDFEAQDRETTDQRRSYASQLFEVCAVNIAKQDKAQIYIQNPFRKDTKDTAERLLQLKDGKKVKIDDSPSCGVNDLEKIFDQVAGSSARERDYTFLYDYPDSHGVRLDTEEKFRSRLIEMKQANRLPAILSMYCYLPPLAHKAAHKTAGKTDDKDEDIPHAVNVTDYDAKTDTLKLDIHWGEKMAQPSYSLSTIFAAMKPKP